MWMCVEFWSSKIIFIPLVKCTPEQNSYCNIVCCWLQVCLTKWLLKGHWFWTSSASLKGVDSCLLLVRVAWRCILFRSYTVSSSVSSGCSHLKIESSPDHIHFSSWKTRSSNIGLVLKLSIPLSFGRTLSCPVFQILANLLLSMDTTVVTPIGFQCRHGIPKIWPMQWLIIL